MSRPTYSTTGPTPPMLAVSSPSTSLHTQVQGGASPRRTCVHKHAQGGRPGHQPRGAARCAERAGAVSSMHALHAVRLVRAPPARGAATTHNTPKQRAHMANVTVASVLAMLAGCTAGAGRDRR